MNGIRQWLDRWKTEYDFKTFVNACGALGITVFFALYNGYLGIAHASVWHGAICVYYILLVLLRGMIIISARKTRGTGRSKAYRRAAVWLLILNVSLVLPLALMVTQQKPVKLTLIPAIAMAAYTTYKVTMASINLKKRKRSSDCLVRLLRTINFIDALVSILTLQNTLIMVNAGGEGMITLTSLTSGAVWIVILVLSVLAIMGRK